MTSYNVQNRKKQEPRGLRLNNPCNIRVSGDLFQGEIRPGRDRSFKTFQTMAHGYRAAFRILINYIRIYKCDTIRKMITRWAPPTENETEAYIHLVTTYSHIPADEPIAPQDEERMSLIVAAMSKMENGREADMNDIRAGWNMLWQ